MANKNGKKKRAIALAGGGPAAGLHIGALTALEEAGIRFDVYTLSCVGAWVGLVYNTRQGQDRAAQTYEFFEKRVFRDDPSYEWFPSNRGFASDFGALAKAWLAFPFSTDRKWDTLVQPEAIVESLGKTVSRFAGPGLPTQRELNDWLFNDVLAVNPWTRYLTSVYYKSDINGLCKIYYADHPALDAIFDDDDRLPPVDAEIYHNAWRMPRGEEPGRMQIFHNEPGKHRHDDGTRYLPITAKSLCACSALPYIEESVRIDEDENNKDVEYTEGALVDTVSLANLLRDHKDLDEVWVSRIVDDAQVKPARNLVDALGNLPMQFAAEVGEDDIKLFRQHLLNQSLMRPRVVEIPLKNPTAVNFRWSHANLKQGFKEGYEAVQSLLRFDEQLREDRA